MNPLTKFATLPGSMRAVATTKKHLVSEGISDLDWAEPTHEPRSPSIVPLCQWTWDLAAQEMHWSDGMFRLLGLEPEPGPRSYEKLIESVYSEDRPAFEDWLQGILAGEAKSQFQHRISGEQEAGGMVCQQAVVLLDDKGGVRCVVGTVQGVAEHRSPDRGDCQSRALNHIDLEQQLLSVTHDIKSPTQSLMMSAHVLADAWEDASRILAEDHREYGEFLLGGLPYTEMREVIPSLIEDIRRDAELIQRFVDDLRENARRPGERFHINDAVTQALRVLRYRTARLTGALRIKLGKQIPLLSGDPKKVQRIVLNLLNNALDALEEPGAGLEITTRVQNQERCVQLVVRDEGHGIPAHLSAHLFEPFFTTKKDSGGAGLGLCITQTLVRELNGTLTLRSRASGGALAMVRFPLSRQAWAYSKDVH